MSSFQLAVLPGGRIPTEGGKGVGGRPHIKQQPRIAGERRMGGSAGPPTEGSVRHNKQPAAGSGVLVGWGGGSVSATNSALNR